MDLTSGGIDGAPLSVDVSRDGEVVSLRLAGELDYANVDRLAEALARVAQERPASPLRIDLRPLEFIDSSGLAALIAAHADAQARGARLEIVRGPPAVQRPVETVGLEQIVPFVDAEEAG